MDVVDTVSRKLFAMSRSKVRLRDIEQWSCDKDVSPRIEDGRIYGVWVEERKTLNCVTLTQF